MTKERILVVEFDHVSREDAKAKREAIRHED